MKWVLKNLDKSFLLDTYFLLIELFLIDQITEVSVLETGRKAKGPSFKKNCLAELLIIFLWCRLKTYASSLYDLSITFLNLNFDNKTILLAEAKIIRL